MKKLVVVLFMVMFIGGLCQAVTIFETFREDVIANETDAWIYEKGTSAGGSIKYVDGEVFQPGQYVHAEIQKTYNANTQHRLYMALEDAYASAAELDEWWVEYDFRVTSSTSSGNQWTLLGLFEKDITNNIPANGAVYDFFGDGPAVGTATASIQAQSRYDQGTGNTYSTDNATYNSAYTIGAAYRAKAHIYTKEADGKEYVALSLYSLGGEDGNVETLLAADTEQTKVMVANGGTFILDAFGIFNRGSSTNSGTNYYDFDNLYFSDEEANENTVAPFIAVPEPATIAILAIGGLLVSRRKR